MKITDVKVINIEVTKEERFKKYIRVSTIGPMEPYEEYAGNRAAWTGGGHRIVPIVIIKTDSGIEGYGFCGGGSKAAQIIVEENFKFFLIGEDPFNTEMLWNKMYRGSIPFGLKGAAIEAISGVDIALWDIKGKSLNIPLCKLLGGSTKSKIKLYASGLHPNNLHNPDYDLLAKEAKDLVDQGFSAVKQRMCAGPRLGFKGMKINEMLVKTVREAVGDDIEIMVDAYMGWGEVDYAIEMINRLEKYHLTWIEEPLLSGDYEGYKYLGKKVRVPIAAGEHEFTRFAFKDIIKDRIVDIVQPDTRRVGGITEGKKIVALAEAFNVPIVFHNSHPETLHLIYSCPSIKLAEYTGFPSWENIDEQFTDILYAGMPKAKRGFIKLDEKAPGLGINLNMEVINKLRV